MDLRQLECFIAVAEEQHFGRAAARLYLSQATVSEAVSRLESELGGKLFSRTTRNVRITPLGSVFLDEARAAYRSVEMAYSAGRELARADARRFRVGCETFSSPAVLSAVAHLHERWPETDFGVEEGPIARLLDGLRGRLFEIVACWAPEPDDAYEYEVVDTSGFCAVVPITQAREGETWSLADLHGRSLIAWNREANSGLYDRFWSAIAREGLRCELTGCALTNAGITGMVLSGRGVGIVLGAYADPRLTTIRYVPLADAPTAECVLVWPRRSAHPLTASFVELVRQHRLVAQLVV